MLDLVIPTWGVAIFLVGLIVLMSVGVGILVGRWIWEMKEDHRGN